MAGRAGVGTSMLTGRGVTAADVATGEAQAQVHPRRSAAKALLPRNATSWREAASARHDWPVGLLAVKLLLAPGFVVGASLATRRFGPRVGGLIGGLPVVAGPILLVYALSHGPGFAAGAAAGTLLGLISLIAFVVVYGRLAGQVSWTAGMLAGWVAFAALTAVFTTVSLPAGAALALAGAA